MVRLLNLWDKFRTGFWFFPGLMTATAVIAGIAMPHVDAFYGDAATKLFPWLQTTPAAAGRTLSAFGGAIAGATGVVFSTTVVVLSLTSQQFGPRLLRMFLSDATTQITLGAFVGTSLYTLLVMRVIREVEGNPIAPDLSVAVGTTMSVLTMMSLVYFIHHIAVSIQAQSILRAVAEDLDESIDRLFPQRVGQALTSEGAEQFSAVEGHRVPVLAQEDGYLQAVDADRLLELAVAHNLVVEVPQSPGAFVPKGNALAYARPASAIDEALDDALCGCFVQGHRPTPRQDVECAIFELVEVAVRALSPGINDPFTAMSALDYLSAAVGRMAEREMPSGYRFDEHNALRVVARPAAFDSALAAAFNQIRQYSRGSADVTIRAFEALGHVAHRTTTPSQREAIRSHADMLDRGADTIPEPNDRQIATLRYERILAVLEAAERRDVRASTHQAQQTPDGSAANGQQHDEVAGTT